MCLAGIEAEMKALIARKQAAEAVTVKPKVALPQLDPSHTRKDRATTDQTIPTLRQRPATT
jgi:hypothetical protein